MFKQKTEYFKEQQQERTIARTEKKNMEHNNKLNVKHLVIQKIFRRKEKESHDHRY